MKEYPADGVWRGDLSDDCVMKTEDGYLAQAEAMDSGRNEHWCCTVTLGKRPSLRWVYHSAENGVWPKYGAAARAMCEMAIDADRWRNRDGNGQQK